MAFKAIGLIIDTHAMHMIVRVLAFIGTDSTLEAPRLDGFLFSLSRPRNILLFIASLRFWIGLGGFLMFGASRPFNVRLSDSMMNDFYFILDGR